MKKAELTTHIYKNLRSLRNKSAPAQEILDFLNTYSKWDVNSEFKHTGSSTPYVVWFKYPEIFLDYLQKKGNINLKYYENCNGTIYSLDSHAFHFVASNTTFYYNSNNSLEKLIDYMIENYDIELDNESKESLYSSLPEIYSNSLVEKILPFCVSDKINKLNFDNYPSVSPFKGLTQLQIEGKEPIILLDVENSFIFHNLLLRQSCKIQNFASKVWPVFLYLDLASESKSNYCEQLLDTVINSKFESKDKILFLKKLNDNYNRLPTMPENHRIFYLGLMINALERVFSSVESYYDLVKHINQEEIYTMYPAWVNYECAKKIKLPYKQQGASECKERLQVPNFVFPLVMYILHHYGDRPLDYFTILIDAVEDKNLGLLGDNLAEIMRAEKLEDPALQNILGLLNSKHQHALLKKNISALPIVNKKKHKI